MIDSKLNKLIKKKKVIIVGPSPHLKNKKKGSFIDSFDCVIRINEIGINENLHEDYGSKTDVSFLTLSEDSLIVYQQMKKSLNYSSLKMVVHAGDEHNLNPFANVAKSRNIFDIFNELNLETDFYHIEKPSFSERCKEFNSFPSTGSLAIKEILKYEFHNLYICGFSFFTTKYMYNKNRQKFEILISDKKAKHNIRMSGHNTRQEVKVLKDIIRNDPKVDGDKFFRRIILSKTNLYYEMRRFIIYKLNFDNYKNIIKKLLRKW
tara:strand:- start:38 stop:826 length:789 start_codon:yes stop_codon:yes gene_type:complete